MFRTPIKGEEGRRANSRSVEAPGGVGKRTTTTLLLISSSSDNEFMISQRSDRHDGAAAAQEKRQKERGKSDQHLPRLRRYAVALVKALNLSYVNVV